MNDIHTGQWRIWGGGGGGGLPAPALSIIHLQLILAQVFIAIKSVIPRYLHNNQKDCLDTVPRLLR